MRELHSNPNTIIKTPVFLDATCSGIQHLAWLLQDLELGTHVNLVPYNEKETPGDIYSEIVDPINKAINKIGEENLEYASLSEVKFTRKIKILKQSIMTKVYNVTTVGIANQLKSKLDYIKSKAENAQETEKLATDTKMNLKQIKKIYKINLSALTLKP